MFSPVAGFPLNTRRRFADTRRRPTSCMDLPILGQGH